MKLNNFHRMPRSGMSLLELTVVILVLLSLVAILFVGARAWMKGSDRAECLMTSSRVQKAVRGYQGFHQLNEGDSLTHMGTIVGPGCMLASEPTCSEYGGYVWRTTIPPVGVPFIDCNDPNNSVDYHYPQNTVDW